MGGCVGTVRVPGMAFHTVCSNLSYTCCRVPSSCTWEDVACDSWSRFPSYCPSWVGPMTGDEAVKGHLQRCLRAADSFCPWLSMPRVRTTLKNFPVMPPKLHAAGEFDSVGLDGSLGIYIPVSIYRWLRCAAGAENYPLVLSEMGH